MKINSATKDLIDVCFQFFQTFISLCVIGLAIYGLFFSEFSQFVEGELRSNLANSQYENLELKKQKDILNAAIEELEEKKEALEQEQWQRVVNVFFKGVRNRVSRYRNANSKPAQIISEIEWTRINAAALDSGALLEDLVKGTAREGRLSGELRAALLNYRLIKTMGNISRATSRENEEQPVKLEIEGYIEAELRRQLFVPVINPVSGEAIFIPPSNGMSTIERLLRDSNVGYLFEDAVDRFRGIVLSFAENNRDQLEKSLEFRMSSINDSYSEIRMQAASASQNVADFELLMEQLKKSLLEGEVN